jgi:hypothetical protein
MRIPDEIRKCVAFLGYKNEDGIHCFAGTAFFVAREIKGTQISFQYIVTAKHVIDKIRDRNCDKVCVRVNRINDVAIWVETDINRWIYHPDADEIIDVAVFKVGLPLTFDHLTLAMSTFITDQLLTDEVGIGSEIFLAGLFANHYGQHRNIPVVRIGNIVAMPEEKVATSIGLMDAYLVEARSLGGISGSPVFASVRGFATSSTEQGVSVRHAESFYLIGLMHGHWDLDYDADVDANVTEDMKGKKAVNMGIAVVVPSSKILEVINQPMVRKEEKQMEADLRKNLLPKPDNLEDDQPLTSPTAKG